MFGAEPLKPSNTGRLIADILPETQAFLWSRTEVDPALLAAINDPERQPYVVFPASYAAPERPVFSELPAGGKPPLFIMLDGTWTEASKMFRKSPYLNQFPVFSLNVTAASNYQLREASRTEQHCTAEVAAPVMWLPPTGWSSIFIISVNSIWPGNLPARRHRSQQSRRKTPRIRRNVA
jgi:hypothetical protein